MKINKNICKNIVSLGIGITSLCNLDCPHCYSRKLVQKSISLQKFKKIINNFSNLKKVNFGTGESILNEDFRKIIDFLEKKNIEMALTSNGTSINLLEDIYLKKFKDIDISLDFPKAELHDRWKGNSGIFDSALRGIERCKKLNITVSIAMVLMNNNYRNLYDFRKLLDKYKIPLRINLYKPVYTKRYSLSYSEFWEAIKILAENFELISNSEPVLTLITKDKLSGSPCGNSARLHPDGEITPCVYLAGKFSDFKKFRELKSLVPKECLNCIVADSCRGGCLGRRLLTYGQPKPDQYCPILNNKKMPKIRFKRAPKKDFVHSSYLCTIIVK